MPIILKVTNNDDFKPIAAGMHSAICYGVVAIGTQPAFGTFKPSKKVIIMWELPDERAVYEKDGATINKPRIISETFTLSLHKKGNLRSMLESWRGRAFNEKELEGWDVSKVIGANCLLNVVHQDKGEKVFANVASVSPLMKSMPQRKIESLSVYFNLHECLEGEEIVFPQNLPEWIITKIKQSEEYTRFTQRGHPYGLPPVEEKEEQSIEEDVPF